LKNVVDDDARFLVVDLRTTPTSQAPANVLASIEKRIDMNIAVEVSFFAFAWAWQRPHG